MFSARLKANGVNFLLQALRGKLVPLNIKAVLHAWWYKYAASTEGAPDKVTLAWIAEQRTFVLGDVPQLGRAARYHGGISEEGIVHCVDYDLAPALTVEFDRHALYLLVVRMDGLHAVGLARDDATLALGDDGVLTVSASWMPQMLRLNGTVRRPEPIEDGPEPVEKV